MCRRRHAARLWRECCGKTLPVEGTSWCVTRIPRPAKSFVRTPKTSDSRRFTAQKGRTQRLSQDENSPEHRTNRRPEKGRGRANSLGVWASSETHQHRAHMAVGSDRYLI